ncbi:unnamed protein product [Candida verbasci]|uniref:Uncharacterized protein n=1 Tax=Candida verbasci TaxID=1227364 RepID=A0A9W4XFQ3_9ASCO|nr:unnamed protein product [Candida verbasci]
MSKDKSNTNLTTETVIEQLESEDEKDSQDHYNLVSLNICKCDSCIRWSTRYQQQFSMSYIILGSLFPLIWIYYSIIIFSLLINRYKPMSIAKFIEIHTGKKIIPKHFGDGYVKNHKLNHGEMIELLGYNLLAFTIYGFMVILFWFAFQKYTFVVPPFDAEHTYAY